MQAGGQYQKKIRKENICGSKPKLANIRSEKNILYLIGLKSSQSSSSRANIIIFIRKAKVLIPQFYNLPHLEASSPSNQSTRLTGTTTKKKQGKKEISLLPSHVLIPSVSRRRPRNRECHFILQIVVPAWRPTEIPALSNPTHPPNPGRLGRRFLRAVLSSPALTTDGKRVGWLVVSRVLGGWTEAAGSLKGRVRMRIAKDGRRLACTCSGTSSHHLFMKSKSKGAREAREGKENGGPRECTHQSTRVRNGRMGWTGEQLADVETLEAPSIAACGHGIRDGVGVLSEKW